MLITALLKSHSLSANECVLILDTFDLTWFPGKGWVYCISKISWTQLGLQPTDMHS